MKSCTGHPRGRAHGDDEVGAPRGCGRCRVWAGFAAVALLMACDGGPPLEDGGGDGGPDGDTSTDGDVDGETDGEVHRPAPVPALERFCRGRDWEATLSPTVEEELAGSYLGVYADVPNGSTFTMKVIPDHPFQVTTVRAAFAGPAGPIRIRLTESFGRTYPIRHPDEGNLFPPVEMDVEESNGERWIELDVSEHGLYLLPTEHYILTADALPGGPRVALETVPEGEVGRALLFLPGDPNAYGTEGNFRLQLAGNSLCGWEDEERWFSPSRDQPWAGLASHRAHFADLDGDGHEDLVLHAGRLRAFLGDGRGGFTEPAVDPFEQAPHGGLAVFGDLDNDGFVDVFVGIDAGADVDLDGDGFTRAQGDCDDSPDGADVYPGAPELPDGRDNDCDGIADDGTGDEDRDGDGWTIAEGDCNDRRADVHPGAPELNDRVDNDCDGFADEDFVNLVLLNDGAGRFEVVEGSGVERLDHTSGAAFGDGNGDGLLDVYYGNWLIQYPESPAVGDAYFLGNGDGTFVDSFVEAGLELAWPLACYGVIWNDYDNDGHQDIYVGNYHLSANQLWQNQGDGTFRDVAVAVGVAYDDIMSPYPQYPGGHSYGGDFGDFDNDGFMDFFMTNLAHPRVQPWSDPSMLLVNQGPPDYRFVNMREELGIIYDEGDVNAAWADFDNDMDLDLVVASLYTGHYSRLYRNDGPAGFVDVTYETGTAVHDAVSAIWADVDEDGDLDLVITDRDGLGESVHLFVNRVGQERNWIQLVLEGVESNRSAIGARVTLEAGGVRQMRDVRGGGGHGNAQSTLVVHFGLAEVSRIDDVTVRWVGGGTETIDGLEPNGRYRVVEGTGRGEELWSRR